MPSSSEGPAGSAGCSKSVSGSGSATRTVTLSGCQGPGAVSISISYRRNFKASNSALNRSQNSFEVSGLTNSSKFIFHFREEFFETKNETVKYSL
jgi:hypothetical protein